MHAASDRELLKAKIGSDHGCPALASMDALQILYCGSRDKRRGAVVGKSTCGRGQPSLLARSLIKVVGEFSGTGSR